MESEQLAGNDEGARLKRFLLAVLAIAATIVGAVIALGFFTLVMSPVTRTFFVDARKKAEMDITSIDSAVSNFIVENGGRAPERLEVIVTPDENGRTILKNRTSIPLDPWGNPYRYEPPIGERDYRVITLGRDGVPGGTSVDADIDNFTINAAASAPDARKR